MKKIILLALMGTGFVVTMPFMAQALDSEKIGQNLDREPNMLIAQYDRDRDDLCRDDRKWIFVSTHYNRRDAERAADRLERRGYRTQIL